MNLNIIQKLFQARTERTLEFASGPMTGTSGTVQLRADGSALVGIGYAQSAHGRTVRLHEADHLRYRSPEAARRRFKTEARKQGLSPECIHMADNAIEDIYISTLPVWQSRPDSVRRDARAVALRELRSAVRSVQRSGIISSPDTAPDVRDIARASFANVCLRCIALRRVYACRLKRVRSASDKLAAQASKLLEPSSSTILQSIVQAIWLGNRGQARQNLLAILTPTPIPPLAGPEPEPEPEHINFADHEENGEIGSCGGTIPIKLITPPLTCPCHPGQDSDPIPDYSSAGYRIRRASLVPLGLGLPVTQPFIRVQTPTPGGVVVIDGSGSMHLSTDRLRRLCRLAPAATVIYYSGHDAVAGYIVVYARNGMRLDDSTPLPNLFNGNTADEAAILYGLSCRASQGCTDPMILVSDLGFCGNSAASTARARDLVRKHSNDGSLRVILSVQDALTEFETGQQATANLSE